MYTRSWLGAKMEIPDNPTTERWDIFLSFAGKRPAEAHAFYDALGKHGRVFFTAAKQDALTNWASDIRLAQQNSDSSVVLVSTESQSAYYQQEEVAFAISLSRESRGAHKVIPVYLDGRPKATEWNLYGLHILQDVSVPEVGGIQAAADRVLLRLGLVPGPLTGVREMASHAPVEPAHVLYKFPRTPRIEPYRIDISLIRECANSISPADAILVVMDANRFRLEADEDAGLIERGALPPSLAEPNVYWTGVFTQAASQGPRMLAALVLSINDSQFQVHARTAKTKILNYLQALPAGPDHQNLPV